jgi:hypothetical protein
MQHKSSLPKKALSKGLYSFKPPLVLRGQLLSPFLTALLENQTAAFRLHASPKTMGHLAPMRIRLKCALHRPASFLLLV